MKKLDFIKRSSEQHWVGNGFPVRSIFTYNDIAKEMSPFLLLDYGGPTKFPPTEEKLGVGEHPHRGFETVTIVYDGEVEHRDSSGGGGKIGPGDIQWMTAASGVVHEEFHGSEFAKKGGPFEMIQLWVNLPKKDKMVKPRYQGILKAETPVVTLENGAGSVRVIAGDYKNQKGPAKTFSPMNVWDIRLNKGHKLNLKVLEGDTTALFILKGSAKLSSGEEIGPADLAVLERAGDALSFEALTDVTLLFLSGTPINEPVIGYGPFVMNTEDEIRQAFVDYRSGKMGHL